MTYRELLEQCKNNPGCLATKEQKEQESRIKYQMMAASTRSAENNKKKK